MTTASSTPRPHFGAPPRVAPRPALAAPRARALEVEGMERLQAAILGAPCDLTQMSTGTLRARLVDNQDRNRSAAWWSLSKAVRGRGIVPIGSVSVVVPLRAPAPALYGDLLATPGTVLAFGSGAEYEAFTPAGFAWASFHVRAEEYASLVEGLPEAAVGLPRHGGKVLPVGPETRERLLHLGRATEWATGVPSDPEEIHLLLERWTSAFAGALDVLPSHGGPMPPSVAGAQILARAEEYLRAHMTESVYLQDLCAACRTNQRTLQNVFRQRVGLTPFEYLRTLRLHQVRRELIERSGDPATSVAEVAKRWGLLHPGRLSVDYRAQFGESPSVTLHAR